MNAQPHTLEGTPSAVPMSDAEFDSFLGSAEFQDLLGDPAGASGTGANASMDDALGTDFGWGPDKPLDAYLRGVDSGRLQSSPSNEVPQPLEAQTPTSDPTILDPVLPVADVEQLLGPAPPAAIPSRSRTPPLAASSGGRSAAVTSLSDEGARFADAALNPPPDDSVVRRSNDNGASSSQESVDTGSAQSPCMSWPPQGMAPHLQRAPHHMPVTSAGPASFNFGMANAAQNGGGGFSGLQHSAMKSGGSMAFSSGMVGMDSYPPQPLWMADGMWQQPMAPNGLMSQQQQPQQFDGSKAFGGGKSASGMRQGSGMASGGSGHNSSGSGNSSQFAFQQHPRMSQQSPAQQQQQQQQEQQQQATAAEERQPMQGMETQQQQQQQQQQMVGMQTATPSGAAPQQASQQQRQAQGDVMQQPQMGVSGMNGMGNMFPGAPHNAYGMRMPPSAAAMFCGMPNGASPGYGMPPMPGAMVGMPAMPPPPHIGFIAAPPPQPGGLTPGASPRLGGSRAASQPATPKSEALVLEELKLLIGQLDPATKSTMKESLYRISRNAQGSTGSKDTGASGAAAAAAARQPGSSDTIGPVDRMVADLLYKDPLQQAPDLPTTLAATAHAQQQSQMARQSWPPTGQREAAGQQQAAAGGASSRARGSSRGSRS